MREALTTKLPSPEELEKANLYVKVKDVLDRQGFKARYSSNSISLTGLTLNFKCAFNITSLISWVVDTYGFNYTIKDPDVVVEIATKK